MSTQQAGPIVLTGPPAAGKTTVGGLLAEALGVGFVDIDALIETEQGRAITEIFAQDGEQVFRALEVDAVARALGQTGVIALGGGAVLTPAVRDLLGGHQVVWLQASVDAGLARVGDSSHRPLLREDIAASLANLTVEREPWYRQLATLTVDTSERSPEQVTWAILDILHGAPEAEDPMVSIEVTAERPYQVWLGHGVLGRIEGLLEGAERVAILHPPVLTGRVQDLARAVSAADRQPVLIEVPAGEAAKTAGTLTSCWRRLAAAGFTRTDLVVGLGGGATTDLAGLVAATFLRGIGWIAVPSTVLGMVDAAVGGKTGIDLPEGKNLVGSFHEPRAVLADLDLLGELPVAEVRSGLAEVAKCGFIADPQILTLIEQNPAEALDVTSARCEELIRRAIQVKAEVVSADLREHTTGTGRLRGREILNYGHTLGHAVEAAEHFAMRHGECVSIGVVFAAELGRRTLGLSQQAVDRHRGVLTALGLPTGYQGADWARLRELMALDKKSRGATLRFVCLRELGWAEILAGPPEQLLRECFAAIGGQP